MAAVHVKEGDGSHLSPPHIHNLATPIGRGRRRRGHHYGTPDAVGDGVAAALVALIIRINFVITLSLFPNEYLFPVQKQ